MATDTLPTPTKPRASATQRVACAHCGLPVPSSMLAEHAAQSTPFCCTGCQAAYEVIRGCGLERYYALRDQAQAANSTGGSTLRASDRRFDEYDDETFQALYARPASAETNLRRIELLLQGVHCSACVWLLEKLPQVVKGVVEARLEVGRAVITVTWDPQVVPLSTIARALDTLGYTPHPARGTRARDIRRKDDRVMLARLGIAGAIAANVMLIFLALYAGAFETMEASHVQLFRWVSMALSVIAMFGPGWMFVRGALAALRARALSLDVPISLGLLAGTIWGVVNTIRGEGDIYFDSISVLIFFLLVGRFIQQRQQRAAADSVELLFSLTPSVASRVGEDGIREVPVEALRVSDVVVVLAGASVPVDGVVLVGSSSVDRSLLTGETKPVTVRVGDHVEAGTINLGGLLRVRVEATGESTRVGKMMRLVEEGSRTKPPIIQWTDQLAIHFIVAMLVLGLATIALWWLALPLDGGLSRGLTNAIALLVVTCPCGLGLATPLVMTMAMGRSARLGILAKNAAAVEALGTRTARRTLLVDKTGTLTEGSPSVTSWTLAEDSPFKLAAVQRFAAALEAGSQHHVAKAIARVAPLSEPSDLPTASDVREVLGAGREGTIQGHHIRIGTRAFAVASAANSTAAICDPLIRAENEILARGESPVFLSINHRPVALLSIGDRIRADAPQVLANLRARGWHIRIASGDAPQVVQHVSAALGIPANDCLGGLAPEAKLALVRASREHAITVMLGDGVNDAPALAAASVGIAVQGGAEASLAATDIYLTRPGLAGVLTLLDGAERTMRAIRWCVIASIAYNIVAAALSITGIINPLLAAIIMPMASLTVLLLALRMPTFAAPRVRPAAAHPASTEPIPHAIPEPSP